MSSGLSVFPAPEAPSSAVFAGSALAVLGLTHIGVAIVLGGLMVWAYVER